MSRLDVDSNFGQIAQKIENHYQGQSALPPKGHPNSRVCPQCQTATWRMTQHCLCCGLDLFALDADERRRRQTWKRLRIGGFFFLVSALAFYGQSHVADTMRIWVMGGGIFSMILAAGVIKD